MKYELLIFDWDGTLMNSISHIVRSLHHAMECMGVEPLPEEQTRDVIGLGMREAVEALFPEQADDDFVRRYVEYYRDFYLDPVHRTELFPGVEEALHTLRDRGFRLGIATSKSRHGLEHVLDDIRVRDLFSVSKTADETRSKPHADMLNAILSETGIPVDRALMIGDTAYDLEMASNAGMDSVGVSYGVHDLERLLQHKPVKIVDHISELDDFLDGQAVGKVLS